MRRIALLLAPALVTSALWAVAPGAQAVDQRPCVSKVEYKSIPQVATQSLVDRRWETPGARRSPDPSRFVLTPPEGEYVRYYPICGYSTGEASLAVSFRQTDQRVRLVVRYMRDGATLHGHP